jgi:ATP phosphoribosyltransferase
MTDALRIALPKGRLFDQTVEFLGAAGIFDGPVDPGRRLVVPVTLADRNIGVPVELLALKNADVPVYVEHGVAQLGVVGSDVLDEQHADVHTIYTLPYGSCRISVAGRASLTADDLRRREVLRVATKYTRRAERYFTSLGQRVELVKLHGSVELAAVLGLADVIVDLVETGRTLRENGLAEIELIDTTRVFLIASVSMRRRHAEAVDAIVAALPLEVT